MTVIYREFLKRQLSEALKRVIACICIIAQLHDLTGSVEETSIREEVSPFSPSAETIPQDSTSYRDRTPTTDITRQLAIRGPGSG